MPCWLKQSTAVDVALGPFLDETDGKTAETGLTITQPDIRLKKNGGAWAQKNAAQTLSHEEAGWYEVALDTTDTNTLGILIVAVHESGALPVWREFIVVPANIYDSVVSGSDLLQVDVQELEGDSQSSVDLKDFADAGYDPSTNKVQGVVLVDSVTDLADGSINAAALAADTITAAKIAADVSTEINAAVLAVLGTPAGASLAADLAAIEAQTDDIADVPTAVWGTDFSTPGLGDSAQDYVQQIRAKTDNLPADPADQSILEGKIDTIDNFLDTEVAAILAAVDTEIAAIITTLGTPAGASLAADLVTIDNFVDALETRIPANVTEPAGVPAATATFAEILAFLLLAMRNKVTCTASELKLHNDAGAVVATAAVSDDATTFERGEFA